LSTRLPESRSPGATTPARALSWHWLGLLALSVAGVLAFEALRVTAALLLGPIAAAMFFAARETPIRVPLRVFVFAQAIVGCMIARTIPATILGEIGGAWPLFVASVGSVIAVSAALGWTLARLKVLPGTTAVWGSFPGAATAMVLMAESFGADVRLVALMQYLRVLLVGLVATAVTRLWLPAHATDAVRLIPASTPLHVLAFAETLALAVIGAWAALKARVPAGPLLVPMFVGLALQDTGLLRIELPWWLLAGCYAVVGWSIGLRFTREILRHAASLLPRVIAGIVALIAVCGLLACALAHFAHVDPLTAYLATSPGGADTVAIIASASPVDVPFVMAMQSARFIVVAFCGPLIARFVARRLPP
jgi:membrane AbrB-like protein